jgi:hypothetical protein
VTHEQHLEALRAEVRYLRDRRDLYRAKSYSQRPTRPKRLEELEREYELAAAHLRRAENADRSEAG